MDKKVKNEIYIEARILARKYNISKIKRVIKILKKTAIDRQGLRYDKNRNTKDPLQDGLDFLPSLKEALLFLPQHKALNLFENTDLEELQRKNITIKYWFNQDTPFYTYREIAEVIKKFIQYLNSNKAFLNNIGYPAKSFSYSQWFFLRLSRLYPIKIPYLIQKPSSRRPIIKDHKDRKERDDEGNLFHSYQWIKEMKKPMILNDPPSFCSYEEAPLIEGLTKEDVECIEEQRMKLFNLKIQILEIAQQHIEYKISGKKVDEDKFWDKCIDTIAVKLFRKDFEIFNKIEEKYSDLFLSSPFTKIAHPLLAHHQIFGFRKNLNSGGINNLLELIAHISRELKIGNLHKTKTKLMPLLNKKIPVSYYQLILSPAVEKIDKIIFEFFDDEIEEKKFWYSFERRLKKDFKKKVDSPIYVNLEIYDRVKPVVDIVKNSIKDGYKIIVQPVKHIPHGSKEICPMELPPDTTWEDITIKFIDGHNVNIKVKSISKDTDYKDIGFEDRRKRKPNEQWLLLELLAKRKRKLRWKDPEATTKMKKKKQLLAQTLKAYFQIDEDPFLPYDKQEQAYTIRIKLIP